MTHFGTLADGRPVEAITIAAGDLTATLLTYGAILQSVRLAGVDHDLTVTTDRLEDWTSGAIHYHGALVAPVANRFVGAHAPLDGSEIAFEANQDCLHLLHSGSVGTHAKLWQVVAQDPSSVTLAVDLPAGEGNFPGNRHIAVTFSAQAPATLRMEIRASTDAPTFLNATNHSYWNLDGTEDWTGHSLRIAADRYLPVDECAAPTGAVADVAGTDMDFRETRAPARGEPALDHNFCLSDGRVALRDVLWLTGAGGLCMTMATTEPGMQVYDGRAGALPGGPDYRGLALEAQGWPDAPNHPDWPSIVLRPGETSTAVTEWRFSR